MRSVPGSPDPRGLYSSHFAAGERCIQPMSTIHETERSDAGLARASDRLGGFAIVAFALAAPWSIAGAQIAVGLGLLSLVGRLFGSPRQATGTPTAAEPGANSFWSSDAAAWPRHWPWTFRVLGLFLLVQALSIVTSVDPLRSLGAFRGSWTYTFPVVFFLLLHGRTARAEQGARLLVGSAALAGLYATLQALTGTSPLDGEVLEDHGGLFMASGTLGHHLTFSGVLLPIFFVALGLAAESAGGLRLRRSFTILAVPAIFAGLFFCFARSGWIGIAAGLLVFALSFGRRVLLASLAALSTVAALAYVFLPAVRGRIATVGPAAGPRFHLWESAWNIGLAHPWLGGGLGSWKALFPLHRAPGEYISIAHPHHDLLNVLVETGFVGALTWVALWVTLLVEVRPARPLARGILAGIAALLLAGNFQCFLTDEEVAQSLMFVIALGLTLRGRSRRPDGSSEVGPRLAGSRSRLSDPLPDRNGSEERVQASAPREVGCGGRALAGKVSS